MMDILLDGSGWLEEDAVLGLLMTLCAAFTYVKMGVCGPSFAKWCLALGWTIWALRFFHASMKGIDIIIAPISMVAIALICCGYCLTQLAAIRKALRTDSNDSWHHMRRGEQR